jgi:hypothetical protein
MPGVIKMNISRLNNAYNQTLYNPVPKQVNTAPKPAAKPVQKATTLSSPMVSRIFNVKPGCGSCGK